MKTNAMAPSFFRCPPPVKGNVGEVAPLVPAPPVLEPVEPPEPPPVPPVPPVVVPPGLADRVTGGALVAVGAADDGALVEVDVDAGVDAGADVADGGLLRLADSDPECEPMRTATDTSAIVRTTSSVN